MSRGLKFCVFQIALIISAQAGAPAFANLVPKIRGCEDYLVALPDRQAEALIARLQASRLEIFKQFGGFKIYPPRAEGVDVQPERVVNIPELIYKRSAWRREIWSWRGQRFLFLDLGLSNLKEDQKLLSTIVFDHLVYDSYQSLKVVYGGNRNRDIADLIAMRTHLTDIVLNEYHKRKNYLKQYDREALKMVNRIYTNADSFALIPIVAGMPLWPDIEAWKIKDLISATIQINYMNEMMSIAPKIESLVSSSYPKQMPVKMFKAFPFEYRIKPDWKKSLPAEAQNILDPKTTAEITRYVKVAKDLPEPISRKLILETFEALKKREIKIALASLDKATFELFSQKYKFKKLADIESQSGDHPEILAFIELDSPEFQEAYDDLVEFTASVSVKGL